MKKQTKQQKMAIKQASQAEIKLLKEQYESKSMTILAVALVAIMLLLSLFNWFQTNSNMFDTARLAIKILVGTFLVLMIYTAVKAILLKNKQENERSKKHWKWFFVCLAGFLGSFYVFPHDILLEILKLNIDMTAFNDLHNMRGLPGIQFRAALLMCGAGIYAVVALIYYGVKSAKLGKVDK
ncbi:MAG: hypothetical protein IKW04_06165 [Clostridia bacterium]|nr:hypothetical protein [Clostridia bacterium]